MLDHTLILMVTEALVNNGLITLGSLKGIQTKEGLELANKNFQLDPKKADLDKYGKLSDYEKTRGEALQCAIAEDEMPEMAYGAMVCGCDHDEVLMADQRQWERWPAPKHLVILNFLDLIFSNDSSVTSFSNLVETGHC